MLHRYWIEFDTSEKELSLFHMGCGVTAFDYEDALNLIKEAANLSNDLPRIKGAIKDIDVSTLDPYHVLPNIGVPSNRGIWFPKI